MANGPSPAPAKGTVLPGAQAPAQGVLRLPETSAAPLLRAAAEFGAPLASDKAGGDMKGSVVPHIKAIDLIMKSLSSMTGELEKTEFRYIEGLLELLSKNGITRECDLVPIVEHASLFYPLHSIIESSGYSFEHNIMVAKLSVLPLPYLRVPNPKETKNLDYISTVYFEDDAPPDSQRIPFFYFARICILAGLLHDMGKIIFNRDMLVKKNLTEEDRAQIGYHPIAGANLVENVIRRHTQSVNGGEEEPFSEAVFKAFKLIEMHHVNFDGSGYPKRSISRDEIPLGARIIRVADTIDAACRGRAFKDSVKSIELVLSELVEGALEGGPGIGQVYDPAITKAFMRAISEYPDTLMELINYRRFEVMGPNGLVEVRKLPELKLDKVRLAALEMTCLQQNQMDLFNELHKTIESLARFRSNGGKAFSV